jgi:voltage-gated potassium channel
MKSAQRFLELFVLIVILYSIAILFIELEYFTEVDQTPSFLLWSERIVTLLFTVEYIVRWAASRSVLYPLRPMAIVDLVAILPLYLSLMSFGTTIVDLRTLRLLRAVRVVRLFKLYRYTNALQSIRNAFYRVRYEFAVIGFAVFTLAAVCSVTLYEFEKDAQPEKFVRLSDAAWCMVATLTTVGYGDSVPETTGGKMVAVFIMIAGLGLFGTFVSLIGSSFLEELRKKPRSSNSVNSEPAMETDALQRFNPREVREAIEEGVFLKRGQAGYLEMARLLTIACDLLQNNGQADENLRRNADT